MEGPNEDVHGSGTNEQTPLLQPEAESQCDTPAQQTPVVNEPSKGLTFRRLMIIPMCACYFFAGSIYTYLVPQYVQDVMKHNDEKEVPHEIQPQSAFLFLTQRHSYDACSGVNKSDPSYDKFTRVQQDTATWLIYINVSSLLPAMFANLIWASYSDRFGRRFALFLCLIGATVRLTVFTVVVYFKFSLVYILIGNILDGLTGSFTGLFAVVFSIASDITDVGKQRTIAIVVVELVIGLTFTISSILSGPLIEHFGFFYPSVAISCLSGVGVVILIFLVQETMPTNQSVRQHKSLFKTISETAKFYFSDGSKVKRMKYILLMLGFFFIGIPAMCRMSLEVLYQLGRPFCWSSTKIGWFGAIKTAVASIFGIGGAYAFRRCTADDTIAFFSLVVTAGVYIVEGLAKTDSVLYSVTVIDAPAGLPFPMIRSLMSCLTPADKQGAIFASIGFVQTLCSLIGTISSNAIYSATITIMNGFVFLLMAGLTFIGAFFILAFMMVQRRYKDDPVETTIIVSPEEDAS